MLCYELSCFLIRNQVREKWTYFLFYNDREHFIRNENFLYNFLSFEPFCDIRIRSNDFTHFFLCDSVQKCESSPEFPIYLNGDRDFIFGEHKFIILGPWDIIDAFGLIFSMSHSCSHCIMSHVPVWYLSISSFFLRSWNKFRMTYRPELFWHMWCERMEEDKKFLSPIMRKFFIVRDSFIEEDHEGWNRCIELIRDDIFAYFFYGLMEEFHGLHIIFRMTFPFSKSRIHLIEESPYSDNRVGIPRSRITEIPHRHLIEPERICSILCDDIIWIDDIFQGFTHLRYHLVEFFSTFFFVVFSISLFHEVDRNESSICSLIRVGEDHPDIGECLKWLFRRNDLYIVEKFVPKSCIEKMEDCMFCPSDILIDLLPVRECCFWSKMLRIMWIHETEVIPAASCPLRHRIRLTFSREILRKLDFSPVWNMCERRLSIPCRFVAFYFREFQWQRRVDNNFGVKSLIYFWKGFSFNYELRTSSSTRAIFTTFRRTSFIKNIRSIGFSRFWFIAHSWELRIILMRNMNEWDRLTPVSLSREEPVTEFIVHFLLPESFFLSFFCEDFPSFFRGETSIFSWVYEDAIFCEGLLSYIEQISAFLFILMSFALNVFMYITSNPSKSNLTPDPSQWYLTPDPSPLEERGGKEICDCIFEIVFDFRVRNPIDMKSARFYFFCTNGIVFLLRFMNLSIQFDDKWAFITIEISNIPSKRLLSTEFESVKPPVSYNLP